MTPYYQDAAVTIYHSDALDLLRSLPDVSVNLIATDPPYFRAVDETWDRAWKSEREFLRWIGHLCREWRRVLAPNGSLYVFASPDMGHWVERMARRYFRLLTNIRWRKPPFSTRAEMFDKDDLRSPFPASETILFAEQVNALGFLREARHKAGLSSNEVGILFPSSTGGPTGAVRNWELGLNTPTMDQWNMMRNLIELPPYECAVRPYLATTAAPYTDVWDFRTVHAYPGKHPCEKPLAMMEHIVRTSSRPGDVVLDTFCGSGTTAIAARNLGRRAIVGDADLHWCGWTARRLSQQTLDLGVA